MITKNLVKQVASLRQQKFRKELGLFVVEGRKMVEELLRSGFETVGLYATQTFLADYPVFAEAESVNEVQMEQMSGQDTPPGILAVVRIPQQGEIEPRSKFVLALDGIANPGNMGTLIRTADALGAGAVILSPKCADPFSPKTLRASMGSVYHLPVYVADIPAAIRTLNAQGYTCLCGHLRGSETLPAKTSKMALLVGNEGNGVTDASAALCYCYRLPMPGKAESLNAAIFGSILLYELMRK